MVKLSRGITKSGKTGGKPVIDWRFYRSKYDAQQVLARSASRLRDEVNLEDLTGVLLGVVEETMQPAQVSLVLRDAGPRPGTAPLDEHWPAQPRA